eukprot:jgi/Botrbrau1/12523/Bobra.0169s0065.1
MLGRTFLVVSSSAPDFRRCGCYGFLQLFLCQPVRIAARPAEKLVERRGQGLWLGLGRLTLSTPEPLCSPDCVALPSLRRGQPRKIALSTPKLGRSPDCIALSTPEP